MQKPRFPVTKVRVKSYTAVRIKKQIKEAKCMRESRSQESSDSLGNAFKKSYM